LLTKQGPDMVGDVVSATPWPAVKGTLRGGVAEAVLHGLLLDLRSSVVIVFACAIDVKRRRESRVMTCILNLAHSLVQTLVAIPTFFSLSLSSREPDVVFIQCEARDSGRCVKDNVNKEQELYKVPERACSAFKESRLQGSKAKVQGTVLLGKHLRAQRNSFKKERPLGSCSIPRLQ
jgi:hypothetical protein